MCSLPRRQQTVNLPAQPSAIASKHDERVQRLREIGAKLRAVTGQQSGSTPTIEVGKAQPVWFMWWGDD